MSLQMLTSAKRGMQWLTLALGAGTLAIIATAVTQVENSPVEGRLLPTHMQGKVIWKTIKPPEMDAGRTAPAHTNIIMQIPDESADITLDVLTGYKGKSIKFWGYCFPQNFDRAAALRRRGFPGTVFLSYKERQERERQQQNVREDRFSIFEDTEEEDLNQDRYYRGTIRNQQYNFHGGTSCYLMSDGPLPVGTDNDDDLANSAVERDVGSDDQNPDTDADGVLDGREIFTLGTSPLLRDSDGDGLIDGIEDRNSNGRRDLDETDATKWDTDNDGLCDGLCKVEKGQKLRGEDKNINGIVDSGETDPLDVDTDKDEAGDLHEVFLCELAGGSEC